ncbi:hypothetical protein [[Limnothrix rosea] IAM M-220]|nr:hypothetical protein [[Limnothrix rosea] IAM M-220]
MNEVEVVFGAIAADVAKPLCLEKGLWQNGRVKENVNGVGY